MSRNPTSTIEPHCCRNRNPHLISMTPLTNLATVIALVMLIALSPALGAGTSTSSGGTHACVCLCFRLSFPLFTRVCVCVGRCDCFDHTDTGTRCWHDSAGSRVGVMSSVLFAAPLLTPIPSTHHSVLTEDSTGAQRCGRTVPQTIG